MRRCGTRRVLAGVLAFGLAGLGGAGAAAAQTFGFRSLGAAEAAAERIMEASGLRADFEIMVYPEPNEQNAEAGIGSPCRTESGECRFILYDPEWLQDIERQTDEWGPISVMAHEVAHHLLGHTVFGNGSNPPIELDADFFSGFILQRLGASLESAQAAEWVIGDEYGSPSHPPRSERLEAIAMGWRDAAARGGGGAGAGEALEAARAELEQMRADRRRLEERLRNSEARKNEAEARMSEAEDRARAAQADRDAAAEALREMRARGEAAEAEIREAEARVQEAQDQVREAEGEIAAAAAERDEAQVALAAAEAENERFGAQAAEAAETADRAFLLVSVLVPVVLATLVLALRKPRREVGRAMNRASQVFHELVGRRPDGSIDLPPAPGPPAPGPPAPGPPAPGPPAPGPPAPTPALPATVFPPRPAAPFDGSGLERCAAPGGFVLGRDSALVDATLDHRSVSRRHARLTRRDGRLRVEDLNSTNGTRVNGRRLEPFAPRVLAPGDAVALGDVDLPPLPA